MTGNGRLDRLLAHRATPHIVLILLTFLVYAGTFFNAWSYDDLPVIVNNPDVRSLADFFRNSYPGRPLRELSFLADHAVFGFVPAGWHLQQLGWHALNGMLLFALARRLGTGRAAAWFAALVFLLHPVQVEVVASLSHRKDLLALAFGLLALHAWLRLADCAADLRWRWFLGAWLLAGIAFLGKETAVILPGLFLLLEILAFPRERRVLLAHPGRLAIIAAGLALAGGAWFHKAGGLDRYRSAAETLLVKMNLIPPFDLTAYWQMVLASWGFVWQRIVWPRNLAVEYVYPPPAGWLAPEVLTVLLLAAGSLGLGGWLVRRREQVALFGLLWFWLAWMVTGNLLWPLAYLSADRYLYFPLAGLALMCAVAAERLLPGGRALRGAVVGGLAAVLAVLTWQQCLVWRSEESLWRNALRVSPQSYAALNSVGKIHADRQDWAGALDHYRRAAAVNSSAPLPRYNLGLTYHRLGDRRMADFFFREFLARAAISDNPADQALARKVRKFLAENYAATPATRPEGR